MRKMSSIIDQNLRRKGARTTTSIKGHLPLITISREKGSGGRPIAYLVASKLGKLWNVYHNDILQEIARNSDLETWMAEEIDERVLPLMEEIIADLFGKRYLNMGAYHRELLSILTRIGSRGNAIVVGRGANFIFRDALKIRTIADVDQRIRWLMQFEKVTRSEAMRRIEESDRVRSEFVTNVFHADQNDIHLYDLTIKTGEYLSIEDAADMIVSLAKKKFKL